MRGMVIVLCVTLLFVGCFSSKRQAAETAARRLRETAVKADKLRIRDGEDVTLCELNGKSNVWDFANHLVFAKLGEPCECEGDYFFDFYSGQRLLDTVSYHHSTHMRWPDGWKGDAYLTEKSRDWLADWLADHGIRYPKQELELARESKRIGDLARAELDKVVPKGLIEGLEKVRKKSRGKARYTNEAEDAFLRSFFKSDEERFLTSFRILGALPMRWAAYYWPQFNIYDHLMRLPSTELDRAFELAARSDDPAVRAGALRIAFSYRRLVARGKPADELRKWILLMASEAYASPFPLNRRIVVDALAEARSEKAFEILRQAVADPHEIVRRKAIRAVADYADQEARQLLRAIATGDLTPRPAPEKEPQDYAKGDGTIGASAYVVYDKDVRPDQEVARELFGKMEREGTSDSQQSSTEE